MWKRQTMELVVEIPPFREKAVGWELVHCSENKRSCLIVRPSFSSVISGVDVLFISNLKEWSQIWACTQILDELLHWSRTAVSTFKVRIFNRWPTSSEHFFGISLVLQSMLFLMLVLLQWLCIFLPQQFGGSTYLRKYSSFSSYMCISSTSNCTTCTSNIAFLLCL